MLRSTIKYKIEQIDGVFVEVPTRQVKPSQTCPRCGHQHKKTLDVRIHECSVCSYLHLGTKLRVETDAERGRNGDAEIFLNEFSPCPRVPASPRRLILVPFGSG
jgi:ribosomal protein L37E